MKLPEQFEERMKKLLGDEYPAFAASYDSAPYQGLRVNTCKITVEEFTRISPFSLRAVPWTQEGFYYSAADRPGKHPWHEAGLYYIQEPSAMATGALAGAVPGERVLDLCAAPGGKTTHLAASMKGEGLLVSNEIHPARSKILSSNVERMGISNAVVTNETPERLAEKFPAFFDRIVVDAPCSGEGMFRKEEQALLQWSPENVKICVERQRGILEQAARMLGPGGVLIYSTCTFAPEEDEGSIAAFLCAHPEFSVKKTTVREGLDAGRPEWAEYWSGPAEKTFSAEILDQLKDTFRLWPHRLEGEGHYVALLQKAGGICPDGAADTDSLAESAPERESYSKRARKEEKRRNGQGRKTASAAAEQEALRLYQDFAREHLRHAPDGIPVLFGEQLFLLPCTLKLDGLKVLRAGLHLGMVRKGRFEPAHALALALKAEDAVRTCSYEANSGEIRAYLRGESLEMGNDPQTCSEKGWALVLADGFPLGWGKLSGGLLKNHYPKGLRISG